MFTKGPKQAGWYPAAQNISAVFGRCGWQPFADSRTRCPPPKNVSRHIAGHIALLFMLRELPPRPASAFLLFYGNKKHSQNGTGKKLKFPAFYQYRSGWFYFLLAEPMKQDRSEAGKREIKSARTVLIKAMISSFYQYHSGCVFYYRRIAGKQKQDGVVSCVA